MLKRLFSLSSFGLGVCLSVLACRSSFAEPYFAPPSGHPTWPAVGPYTNLLTKLPDGVPVCMTVLRERPIDDQSSFGVSIWVQPASTHFWLTLKGAKALSAPVLVLYDDGVPFA